jgi:hypothetical protein
MTQQEIQERNEQIALLLGYINTTSTDKDFNIFENKEKPFSAIPKMIETMSMCFHSDWNWLMESIKFIEHELEHSYSVDIVNKNQCEIVENGEKYICGYGFDTVNNSKIEAVFIAVSDFAKLYNNKEL